jgi:hypothetical protein
MTQPCALYRRPALTAALTGLLAGAPLAQAQEDPATLEEIRQELERQNRIILQQQEAIEALRSPDRDKGSGLSWGGYGVVNYLRHDWETLPDRRDRADVERFVLAPSYRYSDSVWLDAEIEIEHGGTGAAMELDKLEEFGEYEQEVEAGGEVIVEKLNLVVEQGPALNWRFGHMILPVGLTGPNHEPTRYFTATRPEAETALIPVVWHETGIGVFGRLGDFHYSAQVVNGLDSTGFSSRNWIAPGHQGRFEQVNAEALAYVGRLDYAPLLGVTVGASAYHGDTVPNRPKPDMEDAEAAVTVLEGHLQMERGPWTLRALYLHGELDNADAIYAANRTLSNNLGATGNPVGSEARALGVEAGFDLLSLTRSPQRLDLFVRYDDYDSMAATDGDVYDNPRWEREARTAGLNFRPLPRVVFKAHFTTREYGTGETDETAAAGLGFEL